MYYLLGLSLAIYFGFLSAWNVALAVRLPGPFFRGAATCIGGLLLLLFLGSMGLVIDVWEAGRNLPLLSDEFIYKYPDLYHYAGTLEGYLFPYAMLALFILVTYAEIAWWGLTKVNGQPRASNWPLGKLLLSVLIALGFAAFVFHVLDSQVATELSQQSSKAAEQQTQLAAPKIPDSENAWCSYEKLQTDASIPSLPNVYLDFYRRGNTFSATDPTVQQFAAEIRPTILRVRSIAAKPTCQILGQLNPSSNRLDCFANSSHWLYLDARVQASQQQSMEALLDILALQQMSVQWSQNSHDFYHRQTLSVEAFANRAIEELLSLQIFSSEDLRRLSQEPRPDRNASLTRCLEEESHRLRVEYADYYLKTENLASTETFLRIFFARQDQLTLQKAEAHYRLLLSQSSWDRLSALNDRQSTQTVTVGILSSIYLRNWENLVRATIRTETQDRLTIVAMAVYRYALQAGHFPSSLEDLRNVEPDLNITDPCNGQPLAMDIQKDKLILFSVGLNQQVDRNKPPPPGNVNQEQDPQFVVPLPLSVSSLQGHPES